MKNLWEKLSLAGKIIFSVIIVLIIALIVILIVRHNKKSSESSDNNSNTPEVAQVYEPSIGTPLPPDVKPGGDQTSVAATVENSGEVAGATTNEPSNASTPEQAQQMMVAPKTGIDPNDPVEYENSSLKFKATLPAGTQVSEQASDVKFTNKSGSLYYMVSTVNAGAETLQTITAQLNNSPTASNISYTTFGSNKTQAIKFTAKNFGQGVAVIANGKIYYLLGNSKYFSDFKF